MKPVCLFFVYFLSAAFSSRAQDWRYVKNKKVYRNLEEAIKEKEQVYNLEISRNEVYDDRLHLISLMKNLQFLSINNAGLDTLPDEIFKLPEIRTLNLTGNNFRHIPYGVRNFKRLEYFVMYDNKIKLVPEWIRELELLEEIILPRNEIDSISPSIGLLPALNYLSLGANKLKYMPGSIGKLLSLQTLSLSENELVQLPSATGKLLRLRVLDLHNNKLNSLPVELSGLKRLQNLNLSNNDLHELPAVLEELTALTFFGFKNNPLRIWNHDISFSALLEHIELTGKAIDEFPQNIRLCKRLNEIVFTGTSISKIPDWLCSLVKLERLELSNSVISHVPAKLQQLRQLKILILSKNELRSIPDEIILLPGLQVLSVSSNPINNFPRAVLKSRSLKAFFIDGTGISYAEYRAFRKKIPGSVNIPHDSPYYYEKEDLPCYQEDSNTATDHVFRKLETDPSFVKGWAAWNKFASDNIQVTDSLKSVLTTSDTAMSDTVFLKFIVRRHGGLSNILVVSGDHTPLKTEAVRLLRLSCPYWIPSNISGRNINAWFHQAFVFKVLKNDNKIAVSLRVINPLPADLRRLNL
jgi:Leucine-rich repeat (LRR) protein